MKDKKKETRAKRGEQRWRTQALTKAEGTYWILVKNTPTGRVSVSLGYITEEQADRACARARKDDEETKDTPQAGRLVELARKGERDLLLRYLVHSTRIEELLPEVFGPGAERIEVVDYGRMSLKEFANTVWAPVRQKEVALSTWKVERLRLKPITSGTLGRVKMRDLDSAAWETYATTRSDLAPRSRAMERGIYKEILKYAEVLGGADMHAFRRIPGASKRQLKVTPFTKEEVPRLLDAASNPVHRAMFAVGIGNGLRPGELARVQWEDFDFEARRLRVRGTKTEGSDEVVPMTDLSVREAKALWEALGKPSSGPAWVWRGKKVGSFKKSLAFTAERAGLDKGRRVHPNLLRHSFGSIAATSGVPLPVAQKIMRHSTPAMLLRVYAQAGALAMREGLDNFPL